MNARELAVVKWVLLLELFLLHHLAAQIDVLKPHSATVLLPSSHLLSFPDAVPSKHNLISYYRSSHGTTESAPAGSGSQTLPGHHSREGKTKNNPGKAHCSSWKPSGSSRKLLAIRSVVFFFFLSHKYPIFLYSFLTNEFFDFSFYDQGCRTGRILNWQFLKGSWVFNALYLNFSVLLCTPRLLLLFNLSGLH